MGIAQAIQNSGALTEVHKANMEHRYTSHDGLSLFYREFGQGKDTIICLPGLTRNSKDFHDLATWLSGRYRVLCLDLRGRGQSGWDPKWRNYHSGTYVRDTWKLMDELGIEKFIVIGTSLGGLMAMIMAAQQPQRLSAIVLNDIGPELDPVGHARILTYAGKQGIVNNWAEAAERCRESYGLALPNMPLDFWSAFARKTYRVSIDGTLELDMDLKIGQAFRSSARAGRVLTMLRKLGILRRIADVPIDPWESFRAVSMPCLVLRGGISDILSEEIVDRMAAVKPDLVRATIPNRGHAPLLDEPPALAAIDAFLRSLRGL